MAEQTFNKLLTWQGSRGTPTQNDSDTCSLFTARVPCLNLQRANSDTFYFTNIAPQHKDFNQGKDLWQGLENFVLDNTKGERVRASVFSGPIFRSDDRVYRGVAIPQVCLLEAFGLTGKTL
jgi:hypothetical protein